VKKVLFPILALVLALGLAIPMTAAPAAANATVEPVIVYGTELGGTLDTIYVIDVANGTETSVFSPNFDSHVNYVNGNAFDVENHRLYYSSSAKKLYFYDFDLGTQTLAGSMNGLAACAEFYDGKYYYIVQSTDDLRAISLDGDGKVDSDDPVWLNFTAGAKSFAFGDIVITADGILYGSSVTPAEFFSIDLDPLTYTTISNEDAVGLQLAYGCDGVLYGHKAGGDAAGDFYVVDPSDGSIGDAIYTLNTFTDLASGPCLSLELTKSGPECAHEGDIITYNYSVHNDGDVPLTALTVVDSLGISVNHVTDSTYNVGDTNHDWVFDPCETWNFTASYHVPTPQVPDVENEATATAEYYGSEVSDTDTWSVDIFHPSIEVTKSGPEGGWFQSVEAEYDYDVHNSGDCSLTSVSVTDDLAGTATYVSGDDGNDMLDPCEHWYYEASALLECECETITCFTNKATAEGTDTQAMTVTDSACWTVLVFQWQPRTIGYWGNWDNHYTGVQFEALLETAVANSPNIEALEAGNWYGEGNVHDFLLGKPPFKKKEVGGGAYARFTMEKQFLATWLNVKSYMDWINDSYIVGFTGSPDAAMDPNATVFLSGDAATLFGATPTVMDILTTIEGEKGGWGKDDFQTAYGVLVEMNEAESNGYEMFIPPWFDPEACPLVLENKDSTTWQVIGDDGICGKLFYNAAGDEFEYIFCGCGLDADTDYSLIYYADFEDRFNVWGGNNPGALIAEMTTDGCGSVFKAGSVDLGMDLPSEPDANIDTHDYSDAPDYYAHAHGAKIWLVPSDCLTGGTDLPVIVWAPYRFLFETDLITYDDTDD